MHVTVDHFSGSVGCDDDIAIHFMRGKAGDGLAAIDVPFKPDTLGCHLKSASEDSGRVDIHESCPIVNGANSIFFSSPSRRATIAALAAS